MEERIMNEVEQSKEQLVFAQRFRELRGSRTQAEFADFLGLSRPTVGLYESGKRVPDATVLKRIAEKCGVSADYLAGTAPPRKMKAHENDAFPADEIRLLRKASKYLDGLGGKSFATRELLKVMTNAIGSIVDAKTVRGAQGSEPSAVGKLQAAIDIYFVFHPDHKELAEGQRMHQRRKFLNFCIAELEKNGDIQIVEEK